MYKANSQANKELTSTELRLLMDESPADYFDYSYSTNHFWFKLASPLGRWIQNFSWDVKINGKENIPRKSNFVLMPNHLSHSDSYFVIVNLPRSGIHEIADEKLFKSRWFRKFAAMFNAFPVRKGAKNIDIVNYAIKRIKRGDSMLWYPEGQRHKSPKDNNLYPPKLGAGMVAHAVDVPIIPVFLAGTEYVMPVGKKLTWGRGPRSIKVLLEYGKPVYLDDLRKVPSSRETSQNVAERIMAAIEKMRPKGKYRDQSHR